MSTGDVIIAVAAAVVLVALIAAASIRGRGVRAAQRRKEVRQDLDQALERADQAGRERDAALGRTEADGGLLSRPLFPATPIRQRRSSRAGSGTGGRSRAESETAGSLHPAIKRARLRLAA